MDSMRSSGSRTGKRKLELRSPQTSTRQASKRQAKLPFKKQKGPGDPVRRGYVDPSKLMYRSNISGLISTVLELELRDGHIRQLQRTPFWLMIDAIRANDLDPKMFKKCDATVCRVIQTYNLEDEKFNIGGAKLPLRNNDIRDLLGEAICGRTERDEEDVAKLLCLYVCAKLFFATTGEHIGWAFVRVIDKLDTLQQYDWSATIRNTLIGSLNEMHNKPEKVTGCVVALLHSNIIAPEQPDVTPRFCCFEVPAAAIETKECGRIRMDVEPPGVCDERRAVIETDDVGSVEPSFNCWQPAKKTKGDMQMEGGNDYDNKNTGTPTSKEKVAGKLVSRGDVLPVLFPYLLELAGTPDGEDVGEEQRGVHNELITCKVRITELESEINMKDVQICELEQRVETLEKLLGRHAGNFFANLNTVIVDKESEIARLKKQVDRLEKKISNLEDSLDDLEVHEVTQFAVNDGSNQRKPSNSVSGKVSGSANVTSCERAQQFACPTGQPEDVRINELQLVDNDPGIEDLTDDFADGIVHTTVAMGEGSCSPINAQTVAAGNVKDGAAVVVVEGHCEHTAGATSSGPKITSLVKRVKNKARREFRLSDYEYPGIFGRTQVNTNVRLGKSVEPGVIYSVEDIEVERKTWNGFGLNRRHTVWNMLKDEDRELLQRMYTLEGDGLIVWDGGHNGIQVHFTDIKDLVQQNSIHGNVIDAYGAMLTEMHKMVSGRAEYVGTSYIYTSV
ncbi:unnamed protein product [Camellia sinensis]